MVLSVEFLYLQMTDWNSPQCKQSGKSPQGNIWTMTNSNVGLCWESNCLRSLRLQVVILWFSTIFRNKPLSINSVWVCVYIYIHRHTHTHNYICEKLKHPNQLYIYCFCFEFNITHISLLLYLSVWNIFTSILRVDEPESVSTQESCLFQLFLCHASTLPQSIYPTFGNECKRIITHLP